MNLRLFLCFFFSSFAAKAQEKVNYTPAVPFLPKTYVCYQALGPLEIDGYPGEESWQAAAWTQDFVDIEGNLQPAPPLRTRAKMLWDEQYLYIAAEMEEPQVWATLTERDAIIYQDDDFEVFIDPDGDGLHYCEFEINAFNTIWDLLMLRPYRNNISRHPVNLFNWNIPDWKTAVSIKGSLNDPGDEDQGWTVEMAIPWSALIELANPKRAPKEGEQWRLNFSRVDWHMQAEAGTYVKEKEPDTGENRPEENWVWSPQGVVDMHRPETWGYVQFTETKVGEKNIPFRVNPEEKIKWALWQLYHQQYIYRQKHGFFTADRSLLTLPDIKGLADYKLRPVIFMAPNTFEILVPSLERGIYWHINEQGRIWRK
ncbi:MAG TPA: carbohydrate-binding family 9-like protein [Saprospiraceae bacterium]|nr:carbohydrate-binding family 9-like protein [Saprospiraceae bacterium]